MGMSQFMWAHHRRRPTGGWNFAALIRFHAFAKGSRAVTSVDFYGDRYQSQSGVKPPHSERAFGAVT